MDVVSELSLLLGQRQVVLVVLDLHLVGIALSILKIAVMNVVIVGIMPEIVLASAKEEEAAGMMFPSLVLPTSSCTVIYTSWCIGFINGLANTPLTLFYETDLLISNG